MKSVLPPIAKLSAKAPTGITGFDEITGGGLPRGRTTLLVGGAGSGKTLFTLQFLVDGAQNRKEPGIFVAFEGTSQRIVANAASFGWKLAELRQKKLFFMDAQPTADLIQSATCSTSTITDLNPVGVPHVPDPSTHWLASLRLAETM